MDWSRDISIRQKQRAIAMVTRAAALVITTVVFTFYDRATSLRAKTQDLIVSAEIIGSSSTAALAFHDPGSAREILHALQAKQHVINACIYDSDGKVFAKYSRDAALAEMTQPKITDCNLRVAT
jgi:hypothetical protein